MNGKTETERGPEFDHRHTTPPAPKPVPENFGDWVDYLKGNDVALLAGQDSPVFIAHVFTENFKDGEAWVTNSRTPDHPTSRQNSYTSGELVESYLKRALQNHQLWPLPLQHTPLPATREIAEVIADE